MSLLITCLALRHALYMHPHTMSSSPALTFTKSAKSDTNMQMSELESMRECERRHLQQQHREKLGQVRYSMLGRVGGCMQPAGANP